MKNYLGIDIGGTFIKYGILDEQYQVIKKWKKKTRLCHSQSEFYDYLCKGLDVSSISCVGVCAPGVISKESKVMSKASENCRIMMGTTINDEVQSRLNRPVRALNDGHAAGYCEMKLGNGVGSESSVYWLLGTGVGGCYCIGEDIVAGRNNIIGEFSHIPIAIEQNKTVGLGRICSVNALIQSYNKGVTVQDKQHSGANILKKYVAKDTYAIQIVNDWCQNIVLGLRMVIAFYNPEIICIGGGVSEEDWLIEKIRNHLDFEVESQLKALAPTKIMPCKFKNDSNLIGAVLYATDQIN
ncbi:ROK family protein [Vagococcus coleopterorum]|uniref:ROK family protein n=1 Tax=Vagococcus coleopterorum TaxID=2714946 RepID=A0A6G8AP33_9ENTE|nr:ROK family protein [Vagococcus coleopterorum]QIL46838.1 ROK family protein [Vagococcus coleopterorum]